MRAKVSCLPISVVSGMLLFKISKIGKPNARVLPDPVVASTQTSYIEEYYIEIRDNAHTLFKSHTLFFKKYGIEEA